jgi:Predicted outer membrane protein
MNPRIALAVALSAFGTAYAAVPTDDQKFMEDAARAGLAEVDAAKLAQEKGESQAVKDFARHMEEDHTKANEELKKLAASKGVKLPTDVDAKHKRMSAELNKHTAAQFDREYMSQQVSDHKSVVHEFDREAKHGSDADVKKWAADKLPTLRQHLEMAESTAKGIHKENAPADKQPKHDPSDSMRK